MCKTSRYVRRFWERVEPVRWVKFIPYEVQCYRCSQNSPNMSSKRRGSLDIPQNSRSRTYYGTRIAFRERPSPGKCLASSHNLPRTTALKIAKLMLSCGHANRTGLGIYSRFTPSRTLLSGLYRFGDVESASQPDRAISVMFLLLAWTS